MTTILNGAVEATLDVAPETPAEFWERALSLGKFVQNYATSLVHDAAEKAEPEVALQIHHVYNTMQVIVSETEQLKTSIANLRGVSFNDVQHGIENVLIDLLEELKEQFPAPDHAPSHAERRGNVSLVLEKAEARLNRLGVWYGIPEQQLRVHFDPILKHIGDVVITLGSSPPPRLALRDIAS